MIGQAIQYPGPGDKTGVFYYAYACTGEALLRVNYSRHPWSLCQLATADSEHRLVQLQ